LKDGAISAPQSGPKDGWPSLPGGVVANTSSLNTSGSLNLAFLQFFLMKFVCVFFFYILGKGVPSGSKVETSSTKEKSGKIKGKSQPASAQSSAAAVQAEETNAPLAKTNGSNRKAKEKASSVAVLNPTAPLSTQPTKPERQRSTSLSPALSSSSNPTPPPMSSSSSPSSQDCGFLPSMHHQIEILQQGASLAAEEEEIDRARDEAEDFGN